MGEAVGDEGSLFSGDQYPPFTRPPPHTTARTTAAAALPGTPTSAPHAPTGAAATEEQAGSPVASSVPHSQGGLHAFALSESALSEGLPPFHSSPTHEQAAGDEQTAVDEQAAVNEREEGEAEEEVELRLQREAGASGQPSQAVKSTEGRNRGGVAQGVEAVLPGPLLAKERSEIAAPAMSGSGSSSGGSKDEASSAQLSDYSMSFDGIENEEFEVDAATSGRTAPSAAAATQLPPQPSSTEIAEQITSDTMRRVFSDSVEVRLQGSGACLDSMQRSCLCPHAGNSRTVAVIACPIAITIQ